jgi:ABC-type glycerol-3-phosphate transport system substrate-binding protein
MSLLQRIALIAALLALVACGGRQGTPTTTPPGPATPTNAAVTPQTPDITPVPDPGPAALEIWLPPEFGMTGDTGNGRLLNDQLIAYEAAHRGAHVSVRVKAATGPGGLFNSLLTASSAAPAVLPNIIALNRDDLAQAAAAGLLLPLDEHVAADMLADYYAFAQSLGRVGGAWFGLPFAADARVMVYQTSLYPSPPLMFSDIVTGSIALPAAEGSGLTVLNVYLALGGTLTNEAGELAIETTTLARTLLLFQSLHSAGVLPLSSLEHTDTAATWQAFRDRRASLAVTTAQWYMLEYFRVDGAAATLLPTSGEPQMALADGWSWAIVNTRPEHLARSVELLNWLNEPQWQAAWTESSSTLPTRAATLAGWSSRRLVPFVSDVVTHAELRPPSSTLAIIGPPLRQALNDVLNARATPLAAANQAASAINPP